MSAWIALIDPISRLLDKLIPDPDARARVQAALLKAEREADLERLRLALSADEKQTDVNRQEAASAELFVAGWRPFIGWVCGVALAYHFIFQPLLAFAIANAGGNAQLPRFDMDTLSTILMGMLGLSGLRTIEKMKKNPHS